MMVDNQSNRVAHVTVIAKPGYVLWLQVTTAGVRIRHKSVMAATGRMTWAFPNLTGATVHALLQIQSFDRQTFGDVGDTVAAVNGSAPTGHCHVPFHASQTFGPDAG
jgi:hypothetical protein